MLQARLGSNNFFWQSSRRDFRMNILVLNQQQLNLERDNIVRKRSNKGFKKNARGKKTLAKYSAPYPQGILTIKNITHSAAYVFSYSKAFQSWLDTNLGNPKCSYYFYLSKLL